MYLNEIYFLKSDKFADNFNYCRLVFDDNFHVIK